MEELGDDGKILRVIPITAHTSYVIARTEWNIGCISLKRIFRTFRRLMEENLNMMTTMRVTIRKYHTCNSIVDVVI